MALALGEDLGAPGDRRQAPFILNHLALRLYLLISYLFSQSSFSCFLRLTVAATCT